MKKWFTMEGHLYEWLNRIGNLIIISVLFLIGCIPVFTIGPSLISLYYAVAKSIRCGAGYPAGEFWRSWKRNLWKGILLSVWVLLLLFLLNYRQWPAVAVLAILLPMYIPAASRFALPFGRLIELTLVMSVRYFYVTLLLLIGSIAVVLLQLFVLPAVCIVLVPGLYVYLTTFLTEKVLRAYTPKAKDGQKQWFDE